VRGGAALYVGNHRQAEGLHAVQLGAALLQNGQAAEAEAVFRETLEKHPRDGRLLFGLQHSLIEQGRDSEAALVKAQFDAAWEDATAELQVEAL
jgi:Flp pilus assembly protein TadD